MGTDEPVDEVDLPDDALLAMWDEAVAKGDRVEVVDRKTWHEDWLRDQLRDAGSLSPTALMKRAVDAGVNRPDVTEALSHLLYMGEVNMATDRTLSLP